MVDSVAGALLTSMREDRIRQRKVFAAGVALDSHRVVDAVPIRSGGSVKRGAKQKAQEFLSRRRGE
jgi:hypothetical protein